MAAHPGEARDRPGRRADAAGSGHAPLRVHWNDRLLDYDLGPAHPFDERSRGAAMALLAASLAPEERSSVRWERRPGLAPREELLRFHTEPYLARLAAAASAGDRRPLDAGDTPAFPGCDEAAARVVGATLDAARGLLDDGGRALAPGGGLHHAQPDAASGFCILNDVAVTIAHLRARGRRVAYVDLDAHHGDGVMYGFYEDGGLLDIDVHQDGRTLFPGTGAVHETGRGDGAGRKVNLPLPPGAGDASLQALAGRVVAPLLEEFRPDLLVVQHGVDGHAGDPLAQLRYSAVGYAAVDLRLLGLADRLGAPVLFTGGGGYRAAAVSVVLARLGRLAAGLGLPPEEAPLPEAWRALFAETFREPLPARWVDARGTSPPAGIDRLLVELERALGRRFPPP